MLVMFCLQATAQPEGKFYLYNSAKAFLSRAANGDATVDKFGIPVEVKKSDEGYSLMFLDNGRYVAPSGSTVKGDVTSAAYATITADGDNYTVALTEGEFLGVDGSNGALAVKADASASGFNAKWQLLTQAERDVIVADMKLAQIEAVAKAAGISLAVGADKMIAPEIMVASSYGRTTDVFYEGAVLRCASYQEDGYPAGRWRVPTEAEIEFLVELSNYHAIPNLFSGEYFASSGRFYHSANEKFYTVSGSGKNPSATHDDFRHSVRCVYDTWYWGREPVAGLKTGSTIDITQTRNLKTTTVTRNLYTWSGFMTTK